MRSSGKSPDGGKITGSWFRKVKANHFPAKLDAETGIAVFVLTTPEANTSLQYTDEFSTAWGFCWAGGPHGLGASMTTDGEDDRSELKSVVVWGSTTMLNVEDLAG